MTFWIALDRLRHVDVDHAELERVDDAVGDVLRLDERHALACRRCRAPSSVLTTTGQT